MTSVYTYVNIREYLHVERMFVVYLAKCARLSVFFLNHDMFLRTSNHYGIRESDLQWFLIIYLVENKKY